MDGSPQLVIRARDERWDGVSRWTISDYLPPRASTIFAYTIVNAARPARARPTQHHPYAFGSTPGLERVRVRREAFVDAIYRTATDSARSLDNAIHVGSTPIIDHRFSYAKSSCVGKSCTTIYCNLSQKQRNVEKFKFIDHFQKIFPAFWYVERTKINAHLRLSMQHSDVCNVTRQSEILARTCRCACTNPGTAVPPGCHGNP